MGFWSYFTSSILACFLLVYYAYYNNQQFYPTVLFLVSSKLSLIIGGNMLLAVVLFLARVCKAIFFNQLRESEVEMLVEKSKLFVTETCLALTIFRNELSPTVMALFTVLIFVKLLHRLARSRAEYLEQVMPLRVAANSQMFFLFLTLMAIDIFGIYQSVLQVMEAGKSVLLLFGFEFGLLAVHGVNTIARFILNHLDACMTNGLQSKGLCIMVVDLICEMVRFVTYVFFFALIFVYYGIPMHIVRDVWSVYFSLYKKMVNFVQFLRLSRSLEKNLRDATKEELENAGSCLVCREEMETGKKMPCGHVFHVDCLRSWLQHQQSCPLCRADISEQSIHAAAAAAQALALANPDPNPNPNANANAGAGTNANAGAGVGVNNQAPGSGDPAPRVTKKAKKEKKEKKEKKATSTGNSGPLEEEEDDPSQDHSFPWFYVTSLEIVVRQEKNLLSSPVRVLSPNTVVFVLELETTSDGSSWARISDGWVKESTNEAGSGSLLINDPPTLKRMQVEKIPIDSRKGLGGNKGAGTGSGSGSGSGSGTGGSKVYSRHDRNNEGTKGPEEEKGAEKVGKEEVKKIKSEKAVFSSSSF